MAEEDAIKVSELIAVLSKLMAEHGDLPVYTGHEWTSPLFQEGYSGAHFSPKQEADPAKALDYFPDMIVIRV